jgi:hypothetical protein
MEVPFHEIARPLGHQAEHPSQWAPMRAIAGGVIPHQSPGPITYFR